MTTQETPTGMGELIRFPGRQQPHNEATIHTITPASAPNEDTTPGAELAPDTERAPAHRRATIPPALAGHARRVATATGRGAVRAGQAAKPVVAATGRGVVRHSAYTAGGAYEASRRAARRLSHGDVSDAIRAARAAGDLGTVAELMRLKKDEANARVQRAVTMAKLTAQVLGTAAAAWTTTTVVVAISGAIAQLIPGGMNWASVWSDGYWAFWVGLAQWVTWVASFWPWMIAASLVTAGYAAWNIGRSQESAPAWVAPQSRQAATEEITVTPDRIVRALKKCGMKSVRDHIAETGGEGMVDIVSRYGPGVHTTITLPEGPKADELISRAGSIAASLSRDDHEVVMSRVPGHAGKVSLWVADSGALDEPVPASPLMADDYGPVDVYRDAMPWGLSPMGDPVEIALLQRHIVLAGLSKQGKTASARALALWACLDPSVELRIADLKGVGDWSMFDGLATTLIEGSGNEEELAVCAMAEELVAEMSRRKQKRKDMGAKGDVTSKEAKNGSGFHPIIGIIDEVQIAYMSQATGGEDSKRTVGGQKNTSRLWQAAKALHDQARAVNIHFWEFAQNPTDKNLPAIVREGAHLRASLYVSSENIARMAIGDPVVDSGGAPHRLRNEIDAGTVVLAGATEAMTKGQMSTTVRTHYISTADAYTVAERAKQLRTAPAVPADEDRNLLADIAETLGTESAVKARDVVARLRELAPGHRDYQALTAEGLAERLETEHDYKVRKKDGYLTVRSDRIAEARDDAADENPTQ